MRHLILRMARRRVAALLAVGVAVLGGGAFLTTVGVVADSGVRSHVTPGRLAGADVLVTANQSFRPPEDLATVLPERARVPAALVEELSRLPGVVAAVGDVSLPAAAVAEDGSVVAAGDAATAGHGWASAQLLPDGAAALDGTAPSGPDDVVVGAAVAAAVGVGPGAPVRLVVAGETRTFRVSGVLTGSPTGIYLADATAADVAARTAGSAGLVDVVGLRAADGEGGAVADAARALVRGRDTGQGPRLVVSSGSARGDVEDPAAAAGRSTLPLVAGSLSGVTLLIVGFMVGGALGVSISAQRRDLALMRSVGATPRQVRTIAAGQASAVAVLALVPGIALGYVLAERFRELLVGSGLLPAALPLSLGPLPAVATVLLMLGVVQVAARGAAARVSRLPATEAVAESRSEPRVPSRGRAVAGLALLAGSVVLAVTPVVSRTVTGAAGTAMAGIVAAVGLALLGPLLVGRVSGVIARRLPGRASAPGWLAVRNSHAYALRTGASVSTLALVVVFTLTYALTQTTVLAATTADLRAGTTAQLSLAAPALGGLPDDALASVRRLPGVEAAASVTPTTVMWPMMFAGEADLTASPALVLGPGAGDVLDLDVRQGSLADLVGPTIAVDSESARDPAMAVGRSVDLVLGDGATVSARVVAVYGSGLAFGPVVLSRDLATGHTAALDQGALVRTDGTTAAAAAVSAYAGSRPGVVASPAGAASADPAGGSGGVPRELWVNVVVLAMLLGYLLLGVATKLVASTSGRRDEIATLQLAGATPRQVRVMMRWEALLASGIAVVTGVLLSVLPLALLGVGLLDRPWAAGPGWLLPAVVALVGAIAFVAIEVPTRRALRVPPAVALGRAT